MNEKSNINFIDKRAPESTCSDEDAESLKQCIKENSPGLWDRLLDIEQRDDVLEPIASEIRVFVNAYPKPLNSLGHGHLLFAVRRLARSELGKD